MDVNSILTVNSVLGIILTTVIVPLLIWGVAVLTKLGDTKIAQIVDQKTRDSFADAMQNLNESVLTAVGEIQQTFVDALKAAGKFDDAAQKQAFELAFDKTKTIMSNTSMDIIQVTTKSLETLIKSKIEATIQYSK